MRKYYIQIEGNIINAKGVTTINAELNEGQVETTEDFYMPIKIPSSFELDNEGNMVNIAPLQSESEIVDEPIDDEKIAMAEAIIDLNMRIEELENKLNGGV